MSRKIILSPVGTSLLTNNVEPKDRSVLYQHANKQENDVPEKLKSKLNEIEKNVYQSWSEDDIPSLKKISAELNGILGIYEDNWNKGEKDTHILLATHTYQGKLTAELLQGFLSSKVQLAQVIVPKNLNTKTKEDFKSGIRDLLKWCEEMLPGYKKAGYEIVFNLTGGFKSLQGYLNTIGMFYADSISYIFEGADELIEIPRLPIEIKSDQFKNQADIFLQLDQTENGIHQKYLTGISKTMVEEWEDNRYILSDWGQLSWNKAKKDILSEDLVQLPNIKYEPSFNKDFGNNKRPRDRIKLQEKLAKISCVLQENIGDITKLKGGQSGGILYDQYTGTNSHLGHFRLNQGDRVSCEYKNSVLHLRHFGQHDYVNGHP